MSKEFHDYDGCVRAFNALAEAHNAVSMQLSLALETRFSLSVNQFDTMLALGLQNNQCMRLSNIGETVRLSQPAISRLIDRLESRQLVERRDGAADRRNVLVRLTKHGHDVLSQAIPVHAKCVQDALLSRLTDHERDVFKTILEKLIVMNTASDTAFSKPDPLPSYPTIVARSVSLLAK